MTTMCLPLSPSLVWAWSDRVASVEPEWCEPGDDHQSQRSSMRQGHCPLRESCSVYSVEVALLTSAQWTTEAKSKLATVILYMWIGIANFCYALGFVKTKAIVINTRKTGAYAP